jgi:hypothetical protein
VKIVHPVNPEGAFRDIWMMATISPSSLLRNWPSSILLYKGTIIPKSEYPLRKWLAGDRTDRKQRLWISDPWKDADLRPGRGYPDFAEMVDKLREIEGFRKINNE